MTENLLPGVRHRVAPSFFYMRVSLRLPHLNIDLPPLFGLINIPTNCSQC